MDDSTFLITGANGQLGKALRDRYPAATALDSSQLDITKLEKLASFDWSSFTTILNAAAYTAVDDAETPEGRRKAWAVNAHGTANLSAIAADHNLTLVHVSTDYVFDGTEEQHKESESFSPLGVYGQSKAAGDIAATLVPKHYIMRVSWVIGEGKNFVRTMLDLGRKGISPTVVADQIGRLTFTTELGRAIDHLLQVNAPFGTYHMSNGGEPASWSAITREIFNNAGFDLTVMDTTTAEYFADKSGAAPRPLHSTLDLGKLESTGFTPHNWKEDLHTYVRGELKS